MARSQSHARQRSQTNDDAEDEAPTRGGARRRASGGAGRGIWTGSISFGLLQIPVTLYPAESRTEELHFRLLDRRDLSPVKYERVSSSSGAKVDWKDIVKGYEIEKDNFVVLEPNDFAKANVKATQTIEIQDFVPRDQIDPAYFETPYYVIPQPRATKAYVLLRDALAKKQAVAVATFVLRTREHLVSLMPVGDAIMLEVLRFGHELKDASDIPLPSSFDKASVNSRELGMAERLIDEMMTDWKPRKYKDRFYGDVMKIIDEKAKTGVATEHHAMTRGTIAHYDVVDLLDILKKSVAGGGGAGAGAGGKKSGNGAANDSHKATTKRRGPGLKKARPRKRAA